MVLQTAHIYAILCRWEFISTNHDVGFGVYMKSEENGAKVDIVCVSA